MHGLMYDILGATKCADLSLPAGPSDEDGLRPARLAMTYVERRARSKQNNLTDGCLYGNFEAWRSGQKARRLVHHLAQNRASGIVSKHEISRRKLFSDIRTRGAQPVEEPADAGREIHAQSASNWQNPRLSGTKIKPHVGMSRQVCSARPFGSSTPRDRR